MLLSHPNYLCCASFNLLHETSLFASKFMTISISVQSHVITRNQIVTSGGLLSFSDDFNRAGTPIWTKANILIDQRALEGSPLRWNYQCSAEIDQKFSNRHKTTNSQSINQNTWRSPCILTYITDVCTHGNPKNAMCLESQNTIGKCTNGDSIVTTS